MIIIFGKDKYRVKLAAINAEIAAIKNNKSSVSGEQPYLYIEAVKERARLMAILGLHDKQSGVSQ